MKMKRNALAAVLAALAVALIPTQSFAFWETYKDPDTRVPKYSSVTEACKRYIEQRRVQNVIANRVEPILRRALERIQSGEIPESDWGNYTREPQREKKNADQRLTAAEVAVLRAAGYSDWKMYSRYSDTGIGDLWDTNVISGEKVLHNKNHPDHKYTSYQWRSDVMQMCEPYER